MKGVTRGNVFPTAFFHVTMAAVVLAIPVYLGLYRTVSVDLGYEHYAEKADSTLGSLRFPSWVRMPANTIVNLGYVLVGLVWFYRVSSSRSLLTNHSLEDIYLVSVFGSMSIAYGIVQFFRIVSQSFFWSALDQWYTLPFFSWTIIWSDAITNSWRTKSTACVLLLSIVSYNLALLHQSGFEVALGVHVAVALYKASKLLYSNFEERSLTLFLLTVLSCCGFVFLKLGDFQLAKFSIFQELTGHFWSKVCDCLQIHFAAMFFLHVSQNPKDS